MKKTIIALLALGGIAMGADVGSVEFTGGTTYKAGTTYGDLTLTEDMTTGQCTTTGVTFEPNVNIKSDWTWFSAGDYTVSIWVDSASLESDRVLFGYCGSWTSNASGYNGLTWNAESNTLTLGQGEWSAAYKTFTYTTKKSVSDDLSGYITEGLTNITLAVDSATNGKMTADLWINGSKIQTLSTYDGDMQNSATQMKYFLGRGEATYGTVAITNEKLTTAAQIKALATPSIPEPTTATLSLLALAGLAARRRRK